MRARKLLTSPVSAPEAIVRVLEEAGIEFVFGMPGGKTIPIFNALYDHRSGIRTVLVREEGQAAVMADVYGRLTGKPGVTMGQGAFMLTNAGMGIVEAYLAGSPMLVLSELSDHAPFSHHAPYQAGTGDYGTWNAPATIAGYTKQVFVARDGGQAVQHTQLAIKHAVAGQPGPVAVLYEGRALGTSVGPETAPRLYATGPYLATGRPPASADQLAASRQALMTAARPVIIAGNGVRVAQAQPALRALAEQLTIPVATTASGKGVFPETHPLALGVFGNYGLAAANSVVSGADLVMAVGTKLGATDTAHENPALLDPERQTLIQIDVEPRHASWTFPVAHVLLGDARVVLGQLLEACQGSQVTGDGRRRVSDAHRTHASFDVNESVSDETPILPQRLIKELHWALPDDAVVTCDAGENRLFMLHHFQTKDGMEYLQPSAVGGMGYAIPAALAARLVYPQRLAVAVCGDGGFSIGMNGLMTAVEEHIPIVVVVFNNGALGWVLHGQGDRPIASRFAAFDHAAIARAMGCAGVRVNAAPELKEALAWAMGTGQPTVVDVNTSLGYTFRDVSARFVASPRETGRS
jgi:acetolactate synthase-1/2/3 large subunit